MLLLKKNIIFYTFKDKKNCIEITYSVNLDEEVANLLQQHISNQINNSSGITQKLDSMNKKVLSILQTLYKDDNKVIL